MSLSVFDVISSTVLATFKANVATAMDKGQIPLNSGELVVSNVVTYWAHMVQEYGLRS